MKLEISAVAIDSIIEAVFRYRHPVTRLGFQDNNKTRVLAKKLVIDEITSKFNRAVLFIDHCSVVNVVRDELVKRGCIEKARYAR